jgi:hypothetical protein
LRLSGFKKQSFGCEVMEKCSHNIGVNGIIVLVFNSDFEEPGSSDSDIDYAHDLQ